MCDFGWWRKACALFVTCSAIAMAARAQTFTSIANFNGIDGDYAYQMALVQGVDGNLYGTTSNAGANSRGNVFKITPQGALTVVYAFCSNDNCTDGAVPYGGLVLATDGNLYGTTIMGGDLKCNPPEGCGTIFRINGEGALTTIHRFAGAPSDGDTPFSPLLQASDGNLYGTTYRGGTGRAGTVFVLKPGGLVTTLYSFCMSCYDEGWGPQAGLVESLNGELFGTTIAGGDIGCMSGSGCGTVFRITTNGQLTTVHSFELTDGAEPQSALVLSRNGNLYGTTTIGGANCSNDSHSFCGTIFRITAQGKFATVYSFCSQQGCTDGAGPWAALIQGSDGDLYGTTAFGGTSQACNGSPCGTIFQITEQDGLTTLHNFQDIDGAFIYDGLLQATSGIFYGATSLGGDLTCNCGSVYSLDTGLGPFVTFVRPAGKAGQTGGILGQGFTGTTGVSLNGTPANFTVVSDTFIEATVPVGATTGYVTVTTPTGVLTSNVPFHVIR